MIMRARRSPGASTFAAADELSRGSAVLPGNGKRQPTSPSRVEPRPGEHPSVSLPAKGFAPASRKSAGSNRTSSSARRVPEKWNGSVRGRRARSPRLPRCCSRIRCPPVSAGFDHRVFVGGGRHTIKGYPMRSHAYAKRPGTAGSPLTAANGGRFIVARADSFSAKYAAWPVESAAEKITGPRSAWAVARDLSAPRALVACTHDRVRCRPAGGCGRHLSQARPAQVPAGVPET